MCASCVEIARGTSLDVHELDAASNNGVDAMRDLVSHAALGTPGRWKVYIVDEVHMLSNAAANALLKTLEEPPAHVVFVLATTDPQKVPPTIRSRTQHFEFRLLGADTLEALLRDVRTPPVSPSATTRSTSPSAGAAARPATPSRPWTRWRRRARPTTPDQSSTRCSRPSARTTPAGRWWRWPHLTEAGWGPQQLAVELVDDLRQAFLVALAPELVRGRGRRARAAVDPG